MVAVGFGVLQMIKIGFPSALLLLFIALKLTGAITWSWIWVLCPLWIGPVVIFAFLILVGFLATKAEKATIRIERRKY